MAHFEQMVVAVAEDAVSVDVVVVAVSRVESLVGLVVVEALLVTAVLVLSKGASHE